MTSPEATKTLEDVSPKRAEFTSPRVTKTLQNVFSETIEILEPRRPNQPPWTYENRMRGRAPTAAGQSHSIDQVRDFDEKETVCDYEEILLIHFLVATDVIYSFQP